MYPSKKVIVEHNYRLSLKLSTLKCWNKRDALMILTGLICCSFIINVIFTCSMVWRASTCDSTYCHYLL